jgi:hypothetical protein
MQKLKLINLLLAVHFLSSPCWIIVVNASNAKEYYPISDSYVSSVESDINSNFGGQDCARAKPIS